MGDFNLDEDWPWLAAIGTTLYGGYHLLTDQDGDGDGDGDNGGPPETYTLSVNSVGNGQVAIYVNGSKIKTCGNCQVSIERASTVELVPKPDQGYELDYWSDSSNFTIRSNTTITAYFQHKPSGGYPFGLTESQWDKLTSSVQDFVKPPREAKEVPGRYLPLPFSPLWTPKDPDEIQVFLTNADQESVVLKWPDHSDWKNDLDQYAEQIVKLAEFNQVEKIQWNKKWFWDGITYDALIQYLGG